MRVDSRKLALKPCLVLVQFFVVLAQDSVVVEEYRPSEVAKRISAAEVIREQTSLEYPVQAVGLHLVFQVLPVAYKVLMAKNAVMQLYQELTKPFRWLSVFWILSRVTPLQKFVQQLIVVDVVVVCFHV